MHAAFLPQGAPVLNCPGCNTQVADGTAICPSCDYIIDASFLSTNAPDDESSGASRKQGSASRPARASRATGSTRSVASGARAKPAPSPEPEPARDDATNIRSTEEILRNAPPRAANARAGSGPRPAASAASRPAPRRAPEADFADDEPPVRGASRSSSGPVEDPEQVIADFREFVGELSRADRIAFWSALVVVFSSFMPWVETAEEGENLGLLSLGFICVLLSLGVIGALTVRSRKLLPQLNALAPWLTQLSMALVCLVWCLIFMKLSYDATEVPTPIGNATTINSTPSFGAFIGLLGSVGSLVGTLLGLKEKPA
ncbi:hypothetical protein [Melittangium boletus]|uniref:Uncharacterized protein n=1 Tax=Melittangium boletus DSM 14713 TaxID=1294270 RepID=A0A250ITM4_9BACT|nr:hypothetical protein [Melittangium boletus]ATB34537.1 hypothetical protein MEBOL_008042 [Melittangium boletus DSM 14713]